MRRIAAAAVALVVALLAAGGHAAKDYHADAAELGLVIDDVLVNNDPFGRIPPSSRLFQRLGMVSAQSMLDRMDSKTIRQFVSVVLVGFNGDGAGAVRFNTDEVRRKLERLHLPLQPNVLGGVLGGSTRVPLEYRYSFTVSHATPALTAALLSARGSGAKRSYVPLDGVIRSEHHRASLFTTIYIINLPADRTGPYAYTMSPLDTCGTSLLATPERAIWVDLGSQPSEIGPAEGQRVGSAFYGSVTDHSIPSISLFTTSKGVRATSFEAAVAAFIGTVVEHTIAPSVGALPRYRGGSTMDEDVEVRLVVASRRAAAEWAASDALFSAAALEQMLAPLHYAGRSLRVVERSSTDSDVHAFLTQLAAATYGTVTSDGIQERVDAQLLHKLFQRSARAPPSPDVRRIAVFIFDTASSALFDTTDSPYAVFPNAVFVLAGGALQAYPRQFACNGKPVAALPGGLSRAVTAALFEVVWGVGAPYLTWSAQRNSSVPDYTFAAGHSPFGPFVGHSTELAFTLKDAVPRNLVFAHFVEQHEALKEIFSALTFVNYGEYGGLSGTAYYALLRRLSVFHKKWDTIGDFVGDHSYQYALIAIRRLISDALQTVHLQRVCQQAAGDVSASATARALLWLVAAQGLVALLMAVMAALDLRVGAFFKAVRLSKKDR